MKHKPVSEPTNEALERFAQLCAKEYGDVEREYERYCIPRWTIDRLVSRIS
jgi:hypothetical protein